MFVPVDDDDADAEAIEFYRASGAAESEVRFFAWDDTHR